MTFLFYFVFVGFPLVLICFMFLLDFSFCGFVFVFLVLHCLSGLFLLRLLGLLNWRLLWQFRVFGRKESKGLLWLFTAPRDCFTQCMTIFLFTDDFLDAFITLSLFLLLWLLSSFLCYFFLRFLDSFWLLLISFLLTRYFYLLFFFFFWNNFSLLSFCFEVLSGQRLINWWFWGGKEGKV